LPKSEQNRIRFNYWSALTDATSVKDGKLRLQVLISELEHAGYESAARCLSDDLDALVVHLRYPLRHRERWRSTNLLERSLGEVRQRIYSGKWTRPRTSSPTSSAPNAKASTPKPPIGRDSKRSSALIYLPNTATSAPTAARQPRCSTRSAGAPLPPDRCSPPSCCE